MKHIRKIFFTVFLCFLAICLIGTLCLANYRPHEIELSNVSHIVILGAGYRSDGKPALALEKRLDKGIDIWHKHNQNPYLFVSGTKRETHVMTMYLLAHGVPPEKIIQDSDGVSTLATVLNIKNFSQELEAPLFISQAFHIPRIQIYTRANEILTAQYVATDRIAIPPSEIYFFAFREMMAIIFFYAFYQPIDIFLNIHD